MQNSPELLLLKFFPLTYHHSHFLATTSVFSQLFLCNKITAQPPYHCHAIILPVQN